MYESITNNKPNIILEIFKFHHTFTNAKLDYVFNHKDITNTATKSLYDSLKLKLSELNNKVNNNQVTAADALWQYQDILNNKFKELKSNNLNRTEKTIIRRIMNNCLDCCCIAGEYIESCK